MSSSRRQYPFHLIEPKWQKVWDDQQAFRAFNPGDEIPAAHPFAVRHQLSGRVAAAQLPPKFYILDMFPYPSGAGLHVGHPEGYTATDILARYQRARGFNVLHPMGWDSFGLPAEQYAVKTGQHPRKTTEENITTFKRQIKSLGFSYDWSRELATTDPGYFKWTQWIFLKLYNSWFNPDTQKAESIETLNYPASCTTEEQKRDYRDSKRLAYNAELPVWWCSELGTVLANEEIIDGKSEVGNFPVVRKPLRQWVLRITAYADRLLKDLATIDWSDALKKSQTDWIGRSEGAEIDFKIADCALPASDLEKNIRVFTTRPDTLFGATYMVLAPEHKLVDQLLERAKRWQNFAGRTNREITASKVCLVDKEGATQIVNLEEALRLAKEQFKDLIEVDGQAMPPVCRIGDFGMYKFDLQRRAKEILDQRTKVEAYRSDVTKKSDLERTELAKEKTGVFTGAYAINPVHGGLIPIWIADYVLASYGTGAIMAVPAHDTRDYEFATKFNLPIIQVVQPLDEKTDWRGFTGKGTIINSANFEIGLDGLSIDEAKKKITDWLSEKGLGKHAINYKLRDWLFSRQRYWGEPFPIIWKKDAIGLHHEALPEIELPILPPQLDDFKPTPGDMPQPPLGRVKSWVDLPDGAQRETNTMPQWAGSCWYYLRYLDAKNPNQFVSPEAEKYWMGSGQDKELKGLTVKASDASTLQLSNALTVQPFNPSTKPGVDLYVGGTEHAVLHLLYARFWHKVLFDLGLVSTPEPFFKLVNQGLILGEDNQKMSKSRGNVVNPDDVIRGFGTDSLRLFEMFMGPLEMVKPWSTKGVEGVYRFLGRVWRLFVDEASETEFEQAETTTDASKHAELLKLIRLDASIKDVAATPAQLKTLHACIKKVTEDLDGLRFNTAISALMVFVNEAMTWETKPVSVLRDFLILLQPFAPHLAEELWSRLSTPNSLPRQSEAKAGQLPSANLAYSQWPKFDPALLIESEMEIPVQVNGKLRDVIKVSATISQADLEAAAKNAEKAKPFIEGKTIKKVIVVPKKLVNLIVA